MAVTFEPIASQTLTSDTASVTFSSIAGTFTDLVIVGMARSTTSTFNNNAFVRMRFNGDTGSNYSSTPLFTRNTGSGWGVLSLRDSNVTVATAGPIPGPGNGSNIFGPFAVHVMSYANTNVNKTTLGASGYSSDLSSHDGPRREVNLWRNTSAITTILLFPSDGSFVSGSTFSLYGIKAA